MKIPVAYREAMGTMERIEELAHLSERESAYKRIILDKTGGQTQAIHAFLILVLPTIATGICAYQLIIGHVKGWEIAMTLSSYATCHIGITCGFHRLFSHRAFMATPMLRYALATFGSMSIQGPLFYWVANHRRHHVFADASGDPHSPHIYDNENLSGWRGLLHAHFGWTFGHRLSNSSLLCRDLLKDSGLRRINRHYYLCVVASLAIPTIIGWGIERSIVGACNGLVWGAGLRLFISYHVTASINSVTHSFGYRTFKTRDRSTNNPWIGIVSLGEGWHNNHHAQPHAASFRSQWWELDLGWLFIKLMALFGLATMVRFRDSDPAAETSP